VHAASGGIGNNPGVKRIAAQAFGAPAVILLLFRTGMLSGCKSHCGGAPQPGDGQGISVFIATYRQYLYCFPCYLAE